MNLKTIKVIPSDQSHLPDLWEIMQAYPNCFDDAEQVHTIADFTKWFVNNVVDSLTFMDNGEVIGSAFLDRIHEDNPIGRLGIILKRKKMSLGESIPMLKEKLSFCLDKHKLRMVYGVINSDNKASLCVACALGFKKGDTLENHSRINGKPINCVIVMYMRE